MSDQSVKEIMQVALAWTAGTAIAMLPLIVIGIWAIRNRDRICKWLFR